MAKQRLSLRLDSELMAKIQEYKSNRFEVDNTVTDAIVALIKYGLTYANGDLGKFQYEVERNYFNALKKKYPDLETPQTKDIKNTFVSLNDSNNYHYTDIQSVDADIQYDINDVQSLDYDIQHNINDIQIPDTVIQSLKSEIKSEVQLELDSLKKRLTLLESKESLGNTSIVPDK
jgi:hypothetical protein